MEWETLDKLIAEFEARLNQNTEGNESVALGATFWRETWESAARIQEGFREARYPTKEEKDAAWGRFAAARKVSSRRQQEEWKERTGASKLHRDEIFAKMEEAKPDGLTGLDHQTPVRLKELAVALKDAGDLLTQYKDEMLAEQKQECFKALQDIRRSHDALWSEVRQNRQKQRNDQAVRAKENLEKNRERLTKASDALIYFQSRSEELKQKIAEAWNEEWKARATERLTEIDAKIIDIESSITRIEEWISEDEGRAKKIKADDASVVGEEGPAEDRGEITASESEQ